MELAPQYVEADALRTVGAPILGTVALPLPSLDGEPRLEVWPARQEPRRGTTNGIEWADDGEVLFGAISDPGDRPIDILTRDVYDRAIAFARQHGAPYFLRMWNHVGDINAHDEGRERYQLFCAGRYDAFASAGYHLSTDLPSASAVGMRGRGLMTYFLAAREPGVQVENPRQVAAYFYPAQYGPKSPSFSRATVWRDTVFVSGTSSVVGHATVHQGDVAAQLDETLRNIEVVVARALSGGTLANVIAAKTYIRRPEDTALIAERLATVFPRNLFVEADICRADLLLEIEAVAR